MRWSTPESRGDGTSHRNRTTGAVSSLSRRTVMPRRSLIERKNCPGTSKESLDRRAEPAWASSQELRFAVMRSWCAML